MTYWHWLAGISLLFVLLERLLPARRTQHVVRPQVQYFLLPHSVLLTTWRMREFQGILYTWLVM